jgi:hypothetical protein
MRLAANHWGWTPGGMWLWLRYGWAWPIDVWLVEVHESFPTVFRRRAKIGPLCFGLGVYRPHKIGTGPASSRRRGHV